ncbi:hypothetical protein [Hyphomonas sp.]|uniref:hypothetical protein n=1 Tax=Hyphomonas sp. TaxID=87 RepID=UPI003D2E2478
MPKSSVFFAILFSSLPLIAGGQALAEPENKFSLIILDCLVSGQVTDDGQVTENISDYEVQIIVDRENGYYYFGSSGEWMNSDLDGRLDRNKTILRDDSANEMERITHTIDFETGIFSVRVKAHDTAIIFSGPCSSILYSELQGTEEIFWLD